MGSASAASSNLIGKPVLRTHVWRQTEMLRVTMMFTGVPGSPWFNITHWLGNDTAAGAQLAVDHVNQFYLAIGTLIDNAVTWTSGGTVEVIDPATGTLTGTFSVVPATGGGASTALALPQATQGVVQLRTGSFKNGREIRGRIFVPGLTVDALATSGDLTTGAQSTLAGAANALQAWDAPALSVWSRAAPSQAVSVESTAVPLEFAVLRSRRD
jgi:hypothetical protein